MDYLTSFIKGSSFIDFAFIFATVFVGTALIVIGGGMLLTAKTRKFFFLYLAFALLPIILGLGATGMRWYANELILSRNEIDPSSEAAAEIRRNMLPEYVITMLIGAGSSALPLLIGIAGLILKKNRPQ
ncbi:MAG: hypothetical protein ABL984_15570 [Pyrinomonadaceae bacterium]